MHGRQEEARVREENLREREENMQTPNRKAPRGSGNQTRVLLAVIAPPCRPTLNQQQDNTRIWQLSTPTHTYPTNCHQQDATHMHLYGVNYNRLLHLQSGSLMLYTLLSHLLFTFPLSSLPLSPLAYSNFLIRQYPNMSVPLRKFINQNYNT